MRRFSVPGANRRMMWNLLKNNLRLRAGDLKLKSFSKKRIEGLVQAKMVARVGGDDKGADVLMMMRIKKFKMKKN